MKYLKTILLNQTFITLITFLFFGAGLTIWECRSVPLNKKMAGLNYQIREVEKSLSRQQKKIAIKTAAKLRRIKKEVINLQKAITQEIDVKNKKTINNLAKK